MIELQHHRIAANHTLHHYVTAGGGRPLVLLHGFPKTWYQWRAVIDRLAPEFLVIAPDLRGLGGVPGPSGGYDKHSQASDVLAIVEAVAPGQSVILCGHDMGAYVAFAYALDNRDAVDALVTVDAPLPGTALGDGFPANPHVWHSRFHANSDLAQMLITGHEREYISYFITTKIHDRGAITEEDIDLYTAAYKAPGALRAALEGYRALRQDGALNRAALADGGKLSIPFVAVGSEATASAAELEAMAAEMSVGGRVELIADSGHWIPEEKPDELAAIIRAVAAEPRRA